MRCFHELQSVSGSGRPSQSVLSKALGASAERSAKNSALRLSDA